MRAPVDSQQDRSNYLILSLSTTRHPPSLQQLLFLIHHYSAAAAQCVFLFLFAELSSFPVPARSRAHRLRGMSNGITGGGMQRRPRLSRRSTENFSEFPYPQKKIKYRICLSSKWTADTSIQFGLKWNTEQTLTDAYKYVTDITELLERQSLVYD